MIYKTGIAINDNNLLIIYFLKVYTFDLIFLQVPNLWLKMQYMQNLLTGELTGPQSWGMCWISKGRGMCAIWGPYGSRHQGRIRSARYLV